MAVNEQRVNGVAAIMFRDNWATMPKVAQAAVRGEIFKILVCNDEYNRVNGIMEVEMDPTLFATDEGEDGKA